MDVIKIQFKPGTIVLDKETGELLKIIRLERNIVHFECYNTKEYRNWDYIGFLGKIYIKTRASKLLYAKEPNLRRKT